MHRSTGSGAAPLESLAGADGSDGHHDGFGRGSTTSSRPRLASRPSSRLWTAAVRLVPRRATRLRRNVERRADLTIASASLPGHGGVGGRREPVHHGGGCTEVASCLLAWRFLRSRTRSRGVRVLRPMMLASTPCATTSSISNSSRAADRDGDPSARWSVAECATLASARAVRRVVEPRPSVVAQLLFAVLAAARRYSMRTPDVVYFSRVVNGPGLASCSVYGGWGGGCWGGWGGGGGGGWGGGGGGVKSSALTRWCSPTGSMAPTASMQFDLVPLITRLPALEYVLRGRWTQRTHPVAGRVGKMAV